MVTVERGEGILQSKQPTLPWHYLLPKLLQEEIPSMILSFTREDGTSPINTIGLWVSIYIVFITVLNHKTAISLPVYAVSGFHGSPIHRHFGVLVCDFWAVIVLHVYLLLLLSKGHEGLRKWSLQDGYRVPRTFVSRCTVRNRTLNLLAELCFTTFCSNQSITYVFFIHD